MDFFYLLTGGGGSNATAIMLPFMHIVFFFPFSLLWDFQFYRFICWVSEVSFHTPVSFLLSVFSFPSLQAFLAGGMLCVIAGVSNSAQERVSLLPDLLYSFLGYTVQLRSVVS